VPTAAPPRNPTCIGEKSEYTNRGNSLFSVNDAHKQMQARMSVGLCL